MYVCARACMCARVRVCVIGMSLTHGMTSGILSIPSESNNDVNSAFNLPINEDKNTLSN